MEDRRENPHTDLHIPSTRSESFAMPPARVSLCPCGCGERNSRKAQLRHMQNKVYTHHRVQRPSRVKSLLDAVRQGLIPDRHTAAKRRRSKTPVPPTSDLDSINPSSEMPNHQSFPSSPHTMAVNLDSHEHRDRDPSSSPGPSADFSAVSTQVGHLVRVRMQTSLSSDEERNEASPSDDSDGSGLDSTDEDSNTDGGSSVAEPDDPWLGGLSAMEILEEEFEVERSKCGTHKSLASFE